MDEATLHNLSQALQNGEQLTNGPQWLSYSSRTYEGFLSCEEDRCCDTWLDGICDILEYLVSDKDNDWKVVTAVDGETI